MSLYAFGWLLVEVLLGLTLFLLPFSKSAMEAALWTALIAWLFGKLVLRYPWKAPKNLNLLCALFLTAVLLSVFQTEPAQASTAWRGFFKWAKYLGLFFLSYEAFLDEGRARRLIWVFLASAALALGNGFYQMFHETDLVKGYTVDVPGRGIRMRSSFGSPNGFAGYLLLGLPLAFSAWITQNRWSVKASALAALVIAAGVGLFSTLSRGAVLALLASTGLFLLLRRRFVWVGTVVIFLAGLAAASPELRGNFVSSLHAKDITVAERLHMWDVTLDMIRAKPWTGHGVNSYFYTFPLYAPPGEEYRGYAHNSYLQMASETGLAGLFLFIILLATVLTRAWARKNDAVTESLLVGLTAVLFLNAIDTHFYSLQQAVLFWIFWGLLAARTKNP